MGKSMWLLVAPVAVAAGLLVPPGSEAGAAVPVTAWSPVTSPGVFDYGSAATGSTQTFTLTNTGSAATGTLTVRLSRMSAAGAFTKTADRCAGATLKRNQSCTVTIQHRASLTRDSADLTAVSKKSSAQLTLVAPGDVTPPDTTIDAGPGGSRVAPAPSYQFAFSGSDGDGGSGVAGFQCRVDQGAWAACTSPLAVSASAEGFHTFEVRAVDRAGNLDPTPASSTWFVDATPPVAVIKAGPSDPSRSRTPSFEFDSEAGATFECRIDGGDFAACTSPFTVPNPLTEGRHTFEVRATDSVGNVQQSPTSWSWAIDVTPPKTVITRLGSAEASDDMVNFVLTSDEPVSFECQIDASGYAPCPSAAVFGGLADGPHTLSVRATDAAGNVEDPPATHSWIVDTAPPDTEIVSAPPTPTSSPTASFDFTGSDAGTGVAGYECKLDDAGFAPCAPPQTYALSDGTHTFQVRAVDGAGRVDPTPATSTWVVDTVAPDTFISAKTAGPGSPDASFTFNGSEDGLRFECQLDGGGFVPCTSPQQYSGLASGDHTFQVRAIDAAGNGDETPSSVVWTI